MADLTASTLGFPGGSLGRDGGRGGGGGGVGSTDEGVAGRTGEEEPVKENTYSIKKLVSVCAQLLVMLSCVN